MEAARPAGPADLPRIAELVRDGVAELRPTRGGDVWAARHARPEPLEEHLASVVADADQCVLAGTIDDVVVGYAIARAERLSDRRLGVIDDLFVEEGARGIGLGEALMDQLLDWFRERGCSGVDVIALPGHRATKNFFEDSGFTARLLVMYRAL